MNDIKCKFLAQYQFSHVCFKGISNSVWNTEICVIKGHFVNNGDRGKIFMKDTSPLLLKQISRISNDEAKDLIKLMDLGHLSGAIESLIHSILEDYGNTIGKVSLWLRVTDYLRSKGYAVPFMGYSVEELVKMGWIEL